MAGLAEPNGSQPLLLNGLRLMMAPFLYTTGRGREGSVRTRQKIVGDFDCQQTKDSFWVNFKNSSQTIRNVHKLIRKTNPSLNLGAGKVTCVLKTAC